MNESLQRRIIWYSTIIVGTLVSLPKLALLYEGAAIRRMATFNTAEFFFQWIGMLLFCGGSFYLNLYVFPKKIKVRNNRFGLYPWQNALYFMVAALIFLPLQNRFFPATNPFHFIRGAWIMKLSVSLLIILLIIHIIVRLRENQQFELEKEELKRRFSETELELLKQQLNPHFFFNSLSALSALTRENPGKAQAYISHLSHVFRNLLRTGEQVIVLKEELRQLSSYTELLKMRFEEGLQIQMDISAAALEKNIPHFSLQPLIENAAKHNRVNVSMPLRIHIYSEGNQLVVENNLQPNGSVSGTGTGLYNLSERFRLLCGKTPDYFQTESHFIVKLPLV